jgi:hypothetical protein
MSGSDVWTDGVPVHYALEEATTMPLLGGVKRLLSTLRSETPPPDAKHWA